MEELISVVIPAYNVGKYIEKCLDTVITQTYNNLEIILVDDGATDDTAEICDRFAKRDDRIMVIHKKNGGLSDARNAGIDIAKGEYITFIDSDDYIADDYIEFLYKLIKEKDADISMGKQYVVYPNRTINTGSDQKLFLTPEEALEKILYGEDLDVSAWAKLYRRSLFKKVRYPKGRLFEDSATTYKLIDLSKKIAFHSFPIYYYIMRSNSITNCGFNKKKLDLITSTREMTDYVKEKYPKLENACNRRLMFAYLSTLTQMARSKGYEKKDFNFVYDYIKTNRKEVLKDKKIPKRDRVALLSTVFGFRFFKFMWGMYSKITGRV